MAGPANVLTLTAASAPVDLAGLKTGDNSNGTNGAAWTWAIPAGPFFPGPGDTIANTELLKGVSPKSRLYEFLTKSFATQAELDAEWAALGGIVSVNGGSDVYLTTAGPGLPTATMTTTAFSGSLRIAISQSISQ